MSADAQHQQDPHDEHRPLDPAEERERAAETDLEAAEAGTGGAARPVPPASAGRGYTRVDEGHGDLEGGTTGRGRYVDADHGGGPRERDLSEPSADEPGGYTVVDEGDGHRAGGTTGHGRYVDAEHEGEHHPGRHGRRADDAAAE